MAGFQPTAPLSLPAPQVTRRAAAVLAVATILLAFLLSTAEAVAEAALTPLLEEPGAHQVLAVAVAVAVAA